MTTVSVVICTYNEGRWSGLQATIRSLQQQTVAPHEVIVVVDRNDELLRRARAELSGVVVVENSGTPGLGGARNSGVGAASSPIVAFLDDDAVAAPDWLALLADAYRDGEVAGAGGSASPVWETARPGWFPPEFDWVVGCSYLGLPETTQEVRNVFGCNMSFRRDLVQEVGGFRLGYSCDETELCIRLRQRWPDKKVLYIPAAKVSHYVPVSRARFARYLSRCYFEGGSKAVVSRLVGAGDALASERGYVRRILPSGIGRGLSDALRHQDITGAARVGAIAAGLASTIAGYAAASMSWTRAARRRGWSGAA